MTDPTVTIAAIEVGGPDALSFLQGQLTQDIETVGSDSPSYAAWVNPAGRVMTLMDVVRMTDGWRLYLPHSRLQPTIDRLKMYRMRAKVDLAVVGSGFVPVIADSSPTDGKTPQAAVRRTIASTPPVCELFAIDDPVARSAEADRLTHEQWIRARLQAGIPWIGTAAAEKFTAQQINLDLIGAINFGKGCYSGQEIIARTHNLGRVKRRMQRLVTEGSETLVTCGDDIIAADKKIGTVVAASSPGAGANIEILALLPIVGLPDKLALQDGAPLKLASLPYEIPTP